MPDELNNHWTRDEEALGRYVRGEGTEPERRSFAAHAAECAECRRRLADEVALSHAAGEAGREELRRELGRMRQARQARRSLMTRTLAAAAVVVIAAAVWYTPDWFERSAELLPDSAVTLPVPERGRPDQISEEAERPTPPVADVPRESRIRQDLAAGAATGSGVAEQAPAEVMMDEPPVRTEQMLGFRKDVAGPEWTLATKKKAFPSPEVPRAAEVDRAGRDRQEMRDAAAKAVTQGADVRSDDTREIFVLSQQRLISAPPSYQAMARAGQTDQMPARLERSGDSVRIILYPDSVWPDDLFGRAHVMRSGDSVLVQVGTDRIEILVRREPPTSPVGHE